MQIVKLNLIPGGVLPVCFASQHDTGRVIRFMLFEGENVFTLSGAESIELRLQKPDGSELVESVTNTGADYVDVVTTADTCDTAGASVGEIVITDGGDVLGSANFGLFVESDAFEGGGIVTQTASGPIATFETNIETSFVSLKSDINPVQSGTGTPSPDNICPISGFSALNVTRTGKNWANNTATSQTINGVAYSVSTDGKITANNTASGASIIDIGSITLLGGNSYVLSGCPSGGSGSTYALFLRGSGTFAQKIDFGGGNSFTVTDTVTTLLSIIVYNGYTANNLTFEPMVRLSDTTVEYEPYNGQTATVNFGQTVYGGVADVTGGEVNVAYAKKKINELTWNYVNIAGSERFYSTSLSTVIEKPTTIDNVSTLKCSCYETVSERQYAQFTSNNIIAVQTTGYIVIRDTNYTSVSDLLNAVGEQEICYPLATPIEITTTPENLTAISGENNVYSDTNGDTTVEYYIEV